MFNIIPQPVSILINRAQKGFTLHAGTTISPYSFCDDFILFARNVFNKKVRIQEDTGEEKSIILKIDNSIQNDEGYTLKCEDRRVFICAKTETGLFYGLQTLKQLLLQSDGKIPYVEITDEPRFSYRGFNVECKRNFYTVGEIKRIIDLMALHKLNSFKLKHNGYYTQDDIKELVEYCGKKKINYISEPKENALINSNEYPYRFDYPYGINTLKNVCSNDGTLNGSDEPLGIEACANTEHIADVKRFEYLVFPRLAAMAENAWAEKEYPSFSTFVHKAEDYCKLLDAYNVNYALLKNACPSFVYKHASSFWHKIKTKIRKS